MSIKTIIITLLLIVATSLSLYASDDEKTYRPAVNTYYISLGGADLLDTYLAISPYSGLDITLGYERTRRSQFGENHWLSNNLLELQCADALNQSKTATLLSFMAKYQYAAMRSYKLKCGLQLAIGPNISTELGAVYAPQNGNNPVAAKMNANVGLSAVAQYQLKIKNYAMMLSNNLSMPVMGCVFGQPYGASYYEMFYLGNTQNIMHFASFANQFNITNTFAVDFPVRKRSVRVGYKGAFRSTNINNIEYKYYSNAIILGVTIQPLKSFVSKGKTTKEVDAESKLLTVY